MPSADDIMRTVEPGSLPQGDRQKMASQLQQALGSAGGGPPVPAAQPPVSGGGVPSPLSRLLGGGGSSDLPVTDGLSVGPGAGPSLGPVASAENPLIGKLRVIAMEASSPLVRYQARTALRREMKKLHG